MAGSRSLYRKIQEVLDFAKSVDVKTAAELRAEIESTEPQIFKTNQYDRDSDTFVPRVSPRVIRNTVNMCELLDFIGIDGALTDLGREALRKNRFDQILSRQVRSKLKTKGVTLAEINRVIIASLQSRPPVMPTCARIWESCGGTMSYSLFWRLLTLLANCGVAESSQKKIYLHIQSV
jgi:hypothetical protein